MASSTSARPDEKRHVFMRDGQVLYEWDQSLDEINLYIRFSSEQVRSASKDLVVRMKPTHLTISLKAESTPMIDVSERFMIPKKICVPLYIGFCTTAGTSPWNNCNGRKHVDLQ